VREEGGNDELLSKVKADPFLFSSLPPSSLPYLRFGVTHRNRDGAAEYIAAFELLADDEGEDVFFQAGGREGGREGGRKGENVMRYPKRRKR